MEEHGGAACAAGGPGGLPAERRPETEGAWGWHEPAGTPSRLLKGVKVPVDEAYMRSLHCRHKTALCRSAAAQRERGLGYGESEDAGAARAAARRSRTAASAPPAGSGAVGVAENAKNGTGCVCPRRSIMVLVSC